MAVNNAKHWLTAKAMAEACGIDFRTFKKLGVEPVKKGGAGQSHWYSFADVMRAWHTYQLSQHIIAGDDDDDIGTLDLKRETALKIRVEREGRQIKNDIMRGEYASIAMMEETLAAVAATMDGVLTTIPLRIKRKLPDVPTAVLRIVETEVIDAQNKLASIRPDFSE